MTVRSAWYSQRSYFSEDIVAYTHTHFILVETVLSKEEYPHELMAGNPVPSAACLLSTTSVQQVSHPMQSGTGQSQTDCNNTCIYRKGVVYFL